MAIKGALHKRQTPLAEQFTHAQSPVVATDAPRPSPRLPAGEARLGRLDLPQQRALQRAHDQPVAAHLLDRRLHAHAQHRRAHLRGPAGRAASGLRSCRRRSASAATPPQARASRWRPGRRHTDAAPWSAARLCAARTSSASSRHLRTSASSTSGRAESWMATSSAAGRIACAGTDSAPLSYAWGGRLRQNCTLPNPLLDFLAKWSKAWSNAGRVRSLAGRALQREHFQSTSHTCLSGVVYVRASVYLQATLNHTSHESSNVRRLLPLPPSAVLKRHC